MRRQLPACVAGLLLTACYSVHATPRADSGSAPARHDAESGRADAARCVPERCDGADGDCDGVIDEDTDRECGGPGAVGSCLEGRCALTCIPGRADCDGESSGGCETDVTSDLAHCGGCGTRCTDRQFCADGACVDDEIIDVDPPMASHGCLVVASGGVWCWGRNDHNLIGRSALGEVFARPTRVAGLPSARDVEVGDSHSCVIATDGGVHCWGSNLGGRLGVGHGGDTDPVVSVALPLPAQELAADAAYTCAVLTDASVWCFGVAIDGSSLMPVPPTRIDGLPSARDVVALAQGMCALDVDGGWWCWGSNFDRQFASGVDGIYTYPPVRGDVAPLAAASCGAAHCCGQLAAGGLACWGWNYSGQLGIGPASDQHFDPTPVARLTDVSGLATMTTPAGSASCALQDSGEIWCWGRGADGLNALNGADAFEPTLVTIDGVRAVWSNFGGACAKVGPHSLRCWGPNGSGQVGDGTTNPALIPVVVAGFE